MKKKKSIQRVVIGIFFVLLISVLVELICNLRIIMLSSSEKGEISLDNQLIKSEGFQKEQDEYVLEDSKGYLTWDVGGKYVDKFSYKYTCRDLLSTEIIVGVINDFGKVEEIAIKDSNPKILEESVSSIKEKVSWISVHATYNEVERKEGSKTTIANPRINNELIINKHRIVATVLIGLMIISLWFLRKLITQKIEYGFFIIALAMGLIMLVALPANKVGWDEETHFAWAYQMSLFPGDEMVSTEVGEQFKVSSYNWPYNQPTSYEESEEFSAKQNEYYENGDHTVLVEGDIGGSYTPGLIFQAAGIKVARSLGMPYTRVVFMGRFAGLLQYILLVFWAIRIIPLGKRILTFIALMPTSMFLSISYSYDTAVFGFITLGFALVLREWLIINRKVDTKCIVLACIFLLLGILPKAIYAPIVLIVLFIPTDKYKSKKQAYILRTMFIFLSICLILSFVLPQILNPGNATDVRGGAVNSGQQMKYILQYPLSYAIVLLENIFKTLPNYAFGFDVFRSMGHLTAGGFKYLIPIMAVLLILSDRPNDEVKKITFRQRLLIFIMLGFSVALIWTALYISFNIPGSTIIEGVQGRYYRPLLLPLYIILGGTFIEVRISYQKYNAIVLGICTLIIGVTSIVTFSAFYI